MLESHRLLPYAIECINIICAVKPHTDHYATQEEAIGAWEWRTGEKE